ncbi:AsmA family protein [Polynucleobacter sp. AP-Nickl1-40-C4]|uniref:AsmA family protein n=1 Tax=Polynucleobacter sp. AP-Nickl1-40-C4 TaxID=3108275 RepID=UPI002B22B1B5|nr:AsmA family protein [Polynucleobacter sp. AP-Nickl1-40-C4]MEA9568871.1 AsmA family protein [Polynucleobacter sp. AP-Nickl1-40-C4]
MNKTLKIFLIALIGCLAIIGLGAWYASSFINPAQVTKLLSSSVKDATGRELKIAGPVSLSLFPSISVKAEQVSLSNASWASNPDMFVFKQIELDIRILPLLKGSVEISRIGIRGLEANLQTNKAGEGNWNLTPPTIVASGSATQSVTSDSSSNALVSIKTLDVVDARINYQDGEKAASPIGIPKLSLDAGDGKSTILVDVQRANYTLNLKGKTTSLRNAYFAWNQSPVNLDLDLVLTLNGKSLAITGDIDKKPDLLPKFNINLNSKSFDLAPLAGSVVIAGAAGKTSSASTHKAQGKYLFSDDALPFDLLPLADGSVNINIAELGIPHQAPFTNFKTTLQFQKDRIDASDVSFNIGKGSAQAQLSITQFTSPAPKISVKGIAKDFTLEQIIAVTDSSARVSGGDTKVAWNLQGSGVSPHQIASRAIGAIQVSVGQSKLDSKFINKGGDFVITVIDAINPMYKKSNQTTLNCAVAYLPINSGLVNIQNSVGIETDRLDITLAGSINLASEALNISINPREKSGLTTGLDLAGLVKIEGTLQNPQTGVNKAGVVNSAVSIGLGFLTGGISIAAENAKSLATKSQPCKTALHSWSDIYPASK